jgi:hypothetical protein
MNEGKGMRIGGDISGGVPIEFGIAAIAHDRSPRVDVRAHGHSARRADTRPPCASCEPATASGRVSDQRTIRRATARNGTPTIARRIQDSPLLPIYAS